MRLGFFFLFEYDEIMARMDAYLGEFEQHGTDNITVDMDE